MCCEPAKLNASGQLSWVRPLAARSSIAPGLRRIEPSGAAAGGPEAALVNLYQAAKAALSEGRQEGRLSPATPLDGGRADCLFIHPSIYLSIYCDTTLLGWPLIYCGRSAGRAELSGSKNEPAPSPVEGVRVALVCGFTRRVAFILLARKFRAFSSRSLATPEEKAARGAPEAMAAAFPCERAARANAFVCVRRRRRRRRPTTEIDCYAGAGQRAKVAPLRCLARKVALPLPAAAQWLRRRLARRSAPGRPLSN